MSHFAVAVFTDPNGKSLEELLAPYNENLECAPYVEYTKEQAIKHCKETFKDYKDASDEECYQYIAEDYSDNMVDKDGNLLSTYNPNSKWDWYVIGGRGRNFINGASNSELVKDIDFSQNDVSYKKALRWWEVVVEGSPLEDGENKDDFFNMHKIEYLKKQYRGKETYAKCCSCFSTFAVITPDGKWHERGSMGWSGCASNDSGYKWDFEYKERFIDTASPEWTLTIVDCHI